MWWWLASIVATRGRIDFTRFNIRKMNGIESRRELWAEQQLKATLMIVLNTSNEDRDKVEAYNLNVARYILKPVMCSDFVEAVATLNKY